MNSFYCRRDISFHFMIFRRPNRKTFLIVFQENAGLVVPWLIGILTFISFEALGLVYANVLKDQIFGVRTITIHQSCRSLNETRNFRHHLWIIKTISAIKTFTTENFLRFSSEQHFDVFGKTELMFFLTRILLNVSAQKKS